MAFSMTQKVLFRHCDPAGIVFYPRYFEMINDCVEAFFDAIGFPFEDMHKTGAVPTARIEVTFTAPGRHGEMLDLVLTCQKLGRTSLAYEIRASVGGEARFHGRSTLVHVDGSGKPTPWPDDLRAALTTQLEETA